MINLPDVSDARLPVAYEAARKALSECSHMDECQEWADKAAAMASYARQAKDESLHKMALRIQARAIRRCGELLKQIEPGYGANQNIREGDHLKVTRESAASDAGLSEHQRKTALRVASVNGFDEQIESDNPPTITALAEQGKRSLIDLGGRNPSDFKAATHAQGTLLDFAKFAETHDAVAVAVALFPHEREKLRAAVSIIDAWLDRFITSLGD